MNTSALSNLGRRTAAPPISWLMKMTLDRPQLISLAAGFTDNTSLPVTEARELLDEILRSAKSGQPALQYGTTLGDPTLRQLTAQRLQDLDTGTAAPARLQPIYSPARVVITSGSQQLLYMVTEALCDPGDLVLVEDPTYFVYLGIMQSHGLRARGLRLGPAGLDLEHLEQTLETLKRSGELRRLKLLYLVSYFQNPTGQTTSFATKQAALELLQRYEGPAGHPIYLLEDAAYRELRFAGDDVKSALCATPFAERVLYTSTYSKPFATGARVGYGVLPEPVFTAVERIKGNHDFGTTNLLQQLLVGALATGRFHKHLTALRDRYAAKARTLVQAIREHFPKEVEWREPQGGLYVWARLPKRIKTGENSKFFQTALRHEVLYVPGQLCYADDTARTKPNHEMRLSFGGATQPDLRTGIAHLGDALKEMM